jgi:hypothetical protein
MTLLPLDTGLRESRTNALGTLADRSSPVTLSLAAAR